MKHLAHIVPIAHKAKHYLRNALIGAALVIFFADMVAVVLPAFAEAWDTISHGVIAFAAFGAFLADHWLVEEGH